MVIKITGLERISAKCGGNDVLRDLVNYAACSTS
jgi:hypothetical protein